MPLIRSEIWPAATVRRTREQLACWLASEFSLTAENIVLTWQNRLLNDLTRRQIHEFFQFVNVETVYSRKQMNWHAWQTRRYTFLFSVIPAVTPLNRQESRKTGPLWRANSAWLIADHHDRACWSQERKIPQVVHVPLTARVPQASSLEAPQ